MVDTGWDRAGHKQGRSATAELKSEDGGGDNRYERAEREGHRWCRHDRAVRKITGRRVLSRRTMIVTGQLEEGVRMRGCCAAAAGRRDNSRGECSAEQDSDGDERGESSKHCRPYLGAERSTGSFNGTARGPARYSRKNLDSP
jgi:hypothetical protein